MGITAEIAKEHANDIAVLCCKAQAGTVIGPEHLEAPMFLEDLVSSNIVSLDGILTIGQVLGVKLAKDCEALDAVNEEAVGGAVKSARAEEAPVEEVADTEEAAETDVAFTEVEEATVDGTIIISIKEGKDIYIELPV